jgi:PAS domain S-box-containing protein
MARMQTENPAIESHGTWLARALCLGGASLGALGILAWLLGMKRVLTVFPGLPPMMPNSAASLLLLGIAAALVLTAQSGRTPRRFATVAAIVVLAVSLATVAEYVLNIPLFLDELVRDRLAGYYPGRSAPPTAVTLALLAAAILLFDAGSGKRFRPSEWLILAALLIATTALLGYLYGAAAPHYRLTGTPIVEVTPASMRLIRVIGNHFIIGTSFFTAVGLFLISIGLFVGRPDWGTMSMVCGQGPGNLLMQRLAPVAILLPIGFGIVASRLPGTEDAPFVLASLTDGSMTLSLSLLGITAVRLNRGHDTLVGERSRTRELIELASDGIFIADLDGRLTEVNEAACRLQGYSREEILTKSIWDLIPPEDQERLRHHRSGLLEGRTVTEEWTAVRKDGTRLPVEVSAKMLPSRRWQAIVRDISERKRLEEVLRLSETEHRLLAQLATVLAETVGFDQRLTKIAHLFSREIADLCIVDTVADDGSICGAIAACRDPIKQWLCDALMRPPLNGEAARRSSPKIAAGELLMIQKPTPDVIGFLAPNPDERAALQDAQSVIVAPLLARGRLLGAVSLLSFSRVFRESDLRMVRGSSRVAALMLDNARLLAAANQARKARDDMLGVVAHDLRNPLTVIAARGAALRLGAEREIGAEIERASKRMSRLIQDLIDVTRLEAGPLTLKQAMLSSNKALSEALASQVPLASSASLEIRLDAAPELPDIWADHDRLLQVLENLIGNAIRFSKPGGHITLTARAGPSEVQFSVADTGSGIESKHLPRVFDRFWQGPGANRSGAGLGLPIVKGIVEAHGGRVWVQSSPGQGSTFFFTIPTAARASVPQPAEMRARDADSQHSTGPERYEGKPT